jgi:putative restriction endonuclease
MSPRTWSFLTIEGARQYGGNVGYLDDPAKLYRYDSDVANYLQIGNDDVVFLRSRTRVLGVARIEKIVEGEDSKETLRCSICRATNIKERVTKEPRWACKNGHAFDQPIRESVTVRTFEAHYEDTFRATPPSVTVALLHHAVLRPSDQMSIKEVDLAKLEERLSEDPDCRQLIIEYAESITEVHSIDSLSTDEPRNSIIVERRRVLREVSLRRGQVQFRDRLIRRYGCACQVSRCAFPALVEAAHVRPYARTSDNSVDNGLLLRSDLHTLFDLALLTVDPICMRVAVHPCVMKAGYTSFEGVRLFTNGTNGPDRAALSERWHLFQIRLARRIE